MILIDEIVFFSEGVGVNAGREDVKVSRLTGEQLQFRVCGLELTVHPSGLELVVLNEALVVWCGVQFLSYV